MQIKEKEKKKAFITRKRRWIYVDWHLRMETYEDEFTQGSKIKEISKSSAHIGQGYKIVPKMFKVGSESKLWGRL